MNFELIIYDSKDGIATITLNQPDSRNALTQQLTEELVIAIKQADQDETIRAIILTGSGKAFSAGGNVNEFIENTNRDVPSLHFEGRESTELFKLGRTIRTPLIGSINGPALGGGCGIVAMCHMTICSDQAKLGLTELRLGMVPFVILPWIRKAVGDRKAMELMLSADILSAEAARDIGLVHRVVEADQLETETLKFAKKVASYSPLATKLALDSFYTTENMNMMDAFDYLATLRLVSFKSNDVKEGANAFLEKRTPKWTGK